MKTLTAGLLGCVLLAGAAQADVFVSVDAKGSYVLSNVHRPGRTYERVIREPESSLVSLDQQPQMIARQPYAELVSAAATANQLPAALVHAVNLFSPGAGPTLRFDETGFAARECLIDGVRGSLLERMAHILAAHQHPRADQGLMFPGPSFIFLIAFERPQ